MSGPSTPLYLSLFSSNNVDIPTGEHEAAHTHTRQCGIYQRRWWKKSKKIEKNGIDSIIQRERERVECEWEKSRYKLKVASAETVIRKTSDGPSLSSSVDHNRQSVCVWKKRKKWFEHFCANDREKKKRRRQNFMYYSYPHPRVLILTRVMSLDLSWESGCAEDTIRSPPG